MINGKSIIGIVPARGGSKGLPGKNIMTLCGKPLIEWSIEAGLACKYIDEVIVTTDSEEIALIAKAAGALVPFLRPPELACDTSTTVDTVKHVIDYYQTIDKYFDYIVLLEPTSPLRAKDDLKCMIEKINSLDEKYDAIISLGEVHEHPSIMKKIVNTDIQPYCNELVMATRRQDNEVAYFPYGVAYIIKTKILIEKETFYPSRTTYWIIKRYQCFEIDDIYDFLAIEVIMKTKISKK